MDTAFTQLAPDVRLHEADGLPYAGTYHGPDGFRRLLEKVYGLAELTIHHTEFLDAGDTVIARMDTTLTFRATGEAIDMPIVELYRFTGDQITYVDVFYKDTHAVARAAHLP
jgi:hypothetical protein